MGTCLPSNEDIGVNFMADTRFEEDTLFLVFEDDFMFEEAAASSRLTAPVPSSSEPAAGEGLGRPRDRVQLTRGNKDP